MALALASLLSLERLFERDYEDGALDLLALSPAAAGADLRGQVPGPVAGHRRAAGAGRADRRHRPGRPPALAPLIFACALAGGLAFAFVGGIGAALSLGARRGGLLTAVIVLPLFVPPVIFGGGALDAFAGGLPWKAGFALLGAYAAAAVALGPAGHGGGLPQRLS